MYSNHLPPPSIRPAKIARLWVFRLLLLCLGYTLAGSSLLAQTIRYVKPTATGTGNGSSWANASGDLQAMINASSANDQVWVASGVYKPTGTTARNISFAMKIAWPSTVALRALKPA